MRFVSHDEVERGVDEALSDVPLVEGGQGRTGKSLRDDALVVVGCLFGAVLLLIAAVIYG